MTLIGDTPLKTEMNHDGKKNTEETRHEVPQPAKENRQEQGIGEAGEEEIASWPTFRSNSLVLKTRQVDRLLAFYQTLGIEFTEELHAQGPRHFAGRVGEVVIEIYALKDEGTVDTSPRFGFSVGKLAEVIQALEAIDTLIVKRPTQTEWGYQAVVKDPDGRSVELSQE